jgi:hypothetical protein
MRGTVMIEVELTPKQVDLLFPALKQAESAYTSAGNFKACKGLSDLYDTLHKQIYTYGQMEDE